MTRPPRERDASPARLRRFQACEIALHWSVVAPYLVLAVSGGLLVVERLLPGSGLDRATLLRIHWVAGACLLVCPVLVAILSPPRPLLGTLLEAFRWSLRDVLWLHASALRLVLPRVPLPAAGRFNAGQRLNLLHVVTLLPLVALTGVALWAGLGAVLLVRVVHVGGACISLLLAAGHMWLALVNRSTRVARGAMLHGWVGAEYAGHHHARWFEEVTGTAAPTHPARAPLVSSAAVSVALVAYLVAALAWSSGQVPALTAAASAQLGRLAEEPREMLLPAPLHPLHASVAELARCASCHGSGLAAVPDAGCLSCHDEVRARLASATGWHGKVTAPCAECHRDHGQRLITLDDRSFQHDLARFALDGAHREATCDGCHRPHAASRRRYLGLDHQSCIDCHADPHRGRLEPECVHCHRTSGWRDLAATFEHAQDTAFPLSGPHQDLSCGSCHQRDGDHLDASALAETPPACRDCHLDVAAALAGDLPDDAHAERSPHDGELSCVQCHRGNAALESVAACSECHPRDYDRLFVEWRGRVELAIHEAQADRATWTRAGKHHWEAAVRALRGVR